VSGLGVTPASYQARGGCTRKPWVRAEATSRAGVTGPDPSSAGDGTGWGSGNARVRLPAWNMVLISLAGLSVISLARGGRACGRARRVGCALGLRMGWRAGGSRRRFSSSSSPCRGPDARRERSGGGAGLDRDRSRCRGREEPSPVSRPMAVPLVAGPLARRGITVVGHHCSDLGLSALGGGSGLLLVVWLPRPHPKRRRSLPPPEHPEWVAPRTAGPCRARMMRFLALCRCG